MSNTNKRKEKTEIKMAQLLEDLFEDRNDSIDYETVNCVAIPGGLLVQVTNADGVATRFELTIKKVN